MHALDRHWMPCRHAAGTGPALCLVPAGLACENQQSGRVHLDPNLQAVVGTVALSLQAGHEPQKVGISGPPTPERLPSGSPQVCQLRCLAVWDMAHVASLGADHLRSELPLLSEESGFTTQLLRKMVSYV